MAETATIGAELRARFPARAVPRTGHARRDSDLLGRPRHAARRAAVPQARGGPALSDAVRPHRDRRARAAPPRRPAAERLHRRLSPALLRSQRRRPPQGRAHRRAAVDADRSPACGRRANWYEREVWDMFGIGFDGHPNLRRILIAAVRGKAIRCARSIRRARPTWARSRCRSRSGSASRRRCSFAPEDWGLTPPPDGDDEFMFLNLGPQHPGTHGVLRIVLQLDGEEIVDLAPDIGYHHRGAGEDGRAPDLAHLHPLHRPRRLPRRGDEQPRLPAGGREAGRHRGARPRQHHPRDDGRAVPHLQPPGLVRHLRAGRRRAVAGVLSCSPTARSCSTSSRRSAAAACIPTGSASAAWRRTCRPAGTAWCATSSPTCPSACDDYEKTVMKNRIFKGRTAASAPTPARRRSSGASPGRACAPAASTGTSARRGPTRATSTSTSTFRWPTRGDCYARAQVRVEEIWQSLRIIQQCVDNMPAGPYKAEHPLTTPPPKERTMQDIETLITHFLSVSWGPVLPAGEACDHDRGDQGRHQLLPDQRPRHQSLPHAHPHAQLPAHADAAARSPAAR